MVRGKETKAEEKKTAPATKARSTRAMSVPPSRARNREVVDNSARQTRSGSRSNRASRPDRTDTSTTRYEVPTCNYVAMDRIWKTNVARELNSAKQWERKWGFLTTPWYEVVREDFQRLGMSYDSARGRHHSEPIYNRRIAEMPVTASPPVPRTASGMIGWRSADPKLDLEKYSTRNARPISKLEDKLRVHWSEQVRN